MASAHPRTPVLIGAAQYTFRGAPAECPSPQAFMAEAAKRALIDAGIEGGRMDAVDAVGVVGFTLDEVPQMKGLVPTLKNPAAVLAHELGMDAGTTLYTHAGGNTPQALVNLYCERIAKGDCDSVLLGGAEFLGSLTKRLKTGVSLEDWADPLPNAAAPEMFGSDRRGQTPYEDRHGISRPTNVYPLFENAYRHHKGRSIDEHQLAMGELFHPFTKIAAGNPHAWFPTERSAEELGTVTEANRMIGFPYPKFLNSIIQVDQAAALILVSSERADALGIAEEKRIYLHGCADTYELWNPIDRVNFHSSPAIGVAARETLAMAGKTVADIAAFDLYSCFPIAVELACEELGLAPDDPRGLTLTGGLRYNQYHYLGPQEVFQYQEGATITEETVTDTLQFQQGESIVTHHNLDYRVGLKYSILPNLSVKASYNTLHQYLFLLSNTIALAPTDRWKLIDYHTEPMSGQQASFGLYGSFCFCAEIKVCCAFGRESPWFRHESL